MVDCTKFKDWEELRAFAKLLHDKCSNIIFSLESFDSLSLLNKYIKDLEDLLDEYSGEQ